MTTLKPTVHGFLLVETQKIDEMAAKKLAAKTAPHPFDNLGPVLKRLREDSGKTGFELADDLDTQHGNIYRREADANPKAQTIAAFLKATGFTIWDVCRIADELAGVDTRPAWLKDQLRASSDPEPARLDRLVLDSLAREIRYWMSHSPEGRERLKALNVDPEGGPAGKDG